MWHQDPEQFGEDLAPLLLRRLGDADEAGIALGSPLGAEASGYLPMHHYRSQAPFAGVVPRLHVGSLQEDPPMLLQPSVALLQRLSEGVLAAFSEAELVSQSPEALRLLSVASRGQLAAAVLEPDRQADEPRHL